MLAGSKELIDEAWRYKQMLGGALRQAGIVAAGGLYALDHHVDRLAVDHENARLLAEGLAHRRRRVDPARSRPTSSIFDVPTTPPALCAAGGGGRRDEPFGPTRVRAVTHLDVDRAGIDRALVAVRQALSS